MRGTARKNGAFRMMEILGNMAVFVPGMLLCFTAVAVLAAPHLVIALVATFFLMLGVGFCYLGWRVLAVKKKLERVARGFEGKVVIQGGAVKGEADIFEPTPQESSKKILYH